MVVALFALSLVMLVGGIAAVVQGFPYVRLESGLAMVIGGTTAASAGAVLLGIGAAILQLKRSIEALAVRSPERGVATDDFDPTEPLLSAPSTARREPALPALPPQSPGSNAGLAGAAGLAGVAVPAAAAPVPGEGSDRKSPPSFEIEPPLPDLLPPAEAAPIAAKPLPEPVVPPAQEDDLFADDDRIRPAHKEGEPIGLRPRLDDDIAEASADRDEGAAAAIVEEEPEPELQVVGTYSSGGNTYVMFSNGQIEADTPRGRFTFNSLEELKEFVDSGGEGTTRGVA